MPTLRRRNSDRATGGRAPLRSSLADAAWEVEDRVVWGAPTSSAVSSTRSGGRSSGSPGRSSTGWSGRSRKRRRSGAGRFAPPSSPPSSSSPAPESPRRPRLRPLGRRDRESNTGRQSSAPAVVHTRVTPATARRPAQVAGAKAADRERSLHGSSSRFRPRVRRRRRQVRGGSGAGRAATTEAGGGALTGARESDATGTRDAGSAVAGPAAIKVARRFAGAFVLYETGQVNRKVRAAIRETAAADLSAALLKRPPRLPANVEGAEGQGVEHSGRAQARRDLHAQRLPAARRSDQRAERRHEQDPREGTAGRSRTFAADEPGKKIFLLGAFAAILAATSALAAELPTAPEPALPAASSTTAPAAPAAARPAAPPPDGRATPAGAVPRRPPHRRPSTGTTRSPPPAPAAKQRQGRWQRRHLARPAAPTKAEARPKAKKAKAKGKGPWKRLPRPRPNPSRSPPSPARAAPAPACPRS